MYAETSVCRVAAITMAKYIGFKELGIIPSAHYHIDEDKFYDTVFMYLKLDMLR
jgi:RimJ/RimL family protein N-acetyltransferase